MNMTLLPPWRYPEGTRDGYGVQAWAMRFGIGRLKSARWSKVASIGSGGRCASHWWSS
jgi:hypothetical protein